MQLRASSHGLAVHLGCAAGVCCVCDSHTFVLAQPADGIMQHVTGIARYASSEDESTFIKHVN